MLTTVLVILGIASLNGYSSSLRQISWQEAREEVKQAAPSLCQFIDSHESDIQLLPLYKVSYPFGAKIRQKGILQLPNNKSQLVPIHDISIKSSLRKNLNYSLCPFGVLTRHHAEVFSEIPDRVIPLSMLAPGSLLGLSENLNDETSNSYINTGDIISGARSLFLLTKLSDLGCYRKLCREFSLRANIPARFADQWYVFSELSNHQDFPDKWGVEVIYFSSKWFEPKYNKAYEPFQYYLLQKAWKSSKISRNRVSTALVWDHFSVLLEQRQQKTNPYLIQTLQHLIDIAIGALPGFRPADHEDDFGPIQSLQKIIVESYGLKDYIPTMMHMDHLSSTSNNIYYSLQTPTTLKTIPKLKDVRSILDDLRELKILINDFIADSKSGLLELEMTPYHDVINNINFEYFHRNIKKSQNIKSIKDMVRDDPRLLYYSDKIVDDQERRFAESSNFFRGCIRISSK